MKKLSVENFFQEAKIRLKLTPLTSESDMTQRYIVGVDILLKPQLKLHGDL